MVKLDYKKEYKDLYQPGTKPALSFSDYLHLFPVQTIITIGFIMLLKTSMNLSGGMLRNGYESERKYRIGRAATIEFFHSFFVAVLQACLQ